MPNITSISDFTAPPLAIPLAINESAGVDTNSGLTAVITEQEAILLKKVLGDDQYETLQTELGKLPFNPQSGANADPVYIELVNGSGAWNGIRPMLRNFVFCAWAREDEVKWNAVGPGKGKAEGFTVADFSSKFVERWNLFVDELYKLEEYLEASETLVLPEDFPYDDYDYENSFGL